MCTHALLQVKALAGQWDACGLLPAHIAVYGENMAAVHGIKYDALTSPFYMFAGKRPNMLAHATANVRDCLLAA